jgi:hypothetical protein
MPLLRFVTRDYLGWVLPIETLVDDGERIVVWQPAGSTVMHPTGKRGGPRGRNMMAPDGKHEAALWEGTGVIRAHSVGQSWSVWRWEDGDAWRPGFYINLEAPWLRTPLGFDTGDWILDLEVDGAGVITRKDSDELEWSLDVGRLTPREVDVIESAARSAAAALAAGAWPFSADWNAWLPGRTSEPLEIPAGWDAAFQPGSRLE